HRRCPRRSSPSRRSLRSSRMGNYRQPRRLNLVSGIMLLALAAAGYWMWVFFPFYWDAWTVDHELREAVASLYQLSLLTEPGRSTEMRKVLKIVQAKCIKLANIKDPDFDVALDLEGTNVLL